MGKYMKKSKIAGDVAAVIMEAPPPHSSLGVRTRAKTLALQKSPPPPSSPQNPDSSAYLQLRSRRLLKLPPPAPEKSRKCSGESDVANSRLEQSFTKTASSRNRNEKFGHFCAEEDNAECSFGENFLEVESREDRSTRESTPCSLIRDSNAIHTPGSTTRQRTHQIIREHMHRNIPTAYEMEEFFAYAEKQQQAIFMDKYNFDIVNEVPLPGRYEWVPVLH